MAKKKGRSLLKPYIKFLAKRVGQRKDQGIDQPYQEFTDVCVFNTVGITDLYLVKRKLLQGWKIIEFANFPDESKQRHKPFAELLSEIQALKYSDERATESDADFNNYKKVEVKIKPKSQLKKESDDATPKK